MPQRIAIIGGGLSGLCTAFYVKRSLPDVQLTLFEAGDRVGGVIGTERIENECGTFVVDLGADMFAVDPPHALQLCRDLGVEDQLIIPDAELAGAMIVYRGRLVPIPDGFVLMRATKLWQMVTTPILSVGGKLRFLAERFTPLPAAIASADPDQPCPDMSVGAFVRQRMGQEVLDRLVGPLVAGIYTADVEKLSMNATMAPMVAMVRKHGSLAKATLARRNENQDSAERNSAGARYEKFRGFPDGMQQLIDLLADGLGRDTIELQTAATGLRYHGGGTSEANWSVQLDDRQMDFDDVVIATPPAVTAKLLGQADCGECSDVAQQCQKAGDALASIEAASAAIVVMAIKKSLIKKLPPRFGFVVPEIENRRILAASFASHKYSVRCPQDHTIVRVFIGGATQSERLKQNDEQLIQIAKEELADLIGLSGQETLVRVVRWNNAMPQYHVGHLDRVAKIDDAVAQIPHLSIATNALHGVGIAPLVGASKQVAEGIVRGESAVI